MHAPWPQLTFASLRIALSATFFVSGMAKLVAPGSYSYLFHLNLYPAWFGTAVGAVEIVASIGLLWSRTKSLAAYALLPLMAGALWTKLRVSQTEDVAMLELPLVLTVLLAVLLVESYPWDNDRRPRRLRRQPIRLPRTQRRTAPPL